MLRIADDTALVPVLPLEIAKDGARISLFSVIARFGPAQDVTADDLRIESFFAADDATEQLFRAAAARSGGVATLNDYAEAVLRAPARSSRNHQIKERPERIRHQRDQNERPEQDEKRGSGKRNIATNCLALDPKTQTLYAGTGPHGRIYRVTPEGKPTLFYATRQEHVLCVAAGPGGSLYAGTDKGGLVYRIDRRGKAFVLFQAPQSEVRGAEGDAGWTVCRHQFAGKPPQWG